MSDKTRRGLIAALKIVLYVVFVIITIIGARTTSWASLGFECIGLAGVVLMLWIYNRSQK
ncbi:hypothetical protein D2E25_1278 [Bifidobacterium goeldii]|uniref:Uncharacterized protein n=1 Tax=Bifidobacterium goeldii TaxID=2306975 RepID=A0A430FK68_9BIFI|nr:hypothetical protein [Bifidobacterium goeldii]RSX53305.1 hypothetical protein D2E25_1278 [Bifidobacterium goeldii]